MTKLRKYKKSILALAFAALCGVGQVAGMYPQIGFQMSPPAGPVSDPLPAVSSLEVYLNPQIIAGVVLLGRGARFLLEHPVSVMAAIRLGLRIESYWFRQARDMDSGFMRQKESERRKRLRTIEKSIVELEGTIRRTNRTKFNPGQLEELRRLEEECWQMRQEVGKARGVIYLGHNDQIVEPAD